MKKPDKKKEGGFSRRDLFKRAGVMGIAAAGSATLIPPSALEAAPPQADTMRAVQAFTAAQFATVSAITGRFFPTDENGPGAIEAHAATYIDRSLTSHYAYQKDNYTSNLSALDEYCKATHQDSFAALPAEKQDAVLTAMEGNQVDKSFGFTPDSRTFFNLVLEHTQEGMFGDPYYGGNANFIGWDLLDFPGVRLEFNEEEQGLNFPIVKAHRSAYSYNMFKDMSKERMK